MQIPIDRKFNFKNFKDITKLLNKDNLEYFIFYGTLLGYCREKNLLEKDDDIDFLVNIKYANNLIKILTTLNFEISVSTNLFIQGRKEIDNNFFTYVDFYLFSNNPSKNYICDKWTFSGDHSNPANHLYIPKKIIYPIKKSIMQNISVNVPAKTKECCKFLYGDNYTTPLKKGADYRTEIINNKPKQIIINTNPLLRLKKKYKKKLKNFLNWE